MSTLSQKRLGDSVQAAELILWNSLSHLLACAKSLHSVDHVAVLLRVQQALHPRQQLHTVRPSETLDAVYLFRVTPPWQHRQIIDYSCRFCLTLKPPERGPSNKTLPFCSISRIPGHFKRGSNLVQNKPPPKKNNKNDFVYHGFAVQYNWFACNTSGL